MRTSLVAMTHRLIRRAVDFVKRPFRRQFDHSEPAQHRDPNTSEYWDRIWSVDQIGDRSKPELEARIIALVERDSTVIDLGCGAGELITRLQQERGAVCTGADFSATALAKLEAHGFRTLHVALPRVPAPTASFDVAVCLETLEHIDDYVGVICEMDRITREGGMLIVGTPDGSLWGAGGEHINAFTAADLVRLLRSHVREVNVVWLIDTGYPHLLAWGIKDSTARVLFDGRTLRSDADELL